MITTAPFHGFNKPSAAGGGGGSAPPSLITSIWDWWEPSRETGLSDGNELTLTGQANARNFTLAPSGQRMLYSTSSALNGHAVGDFSSGTKQILAPPGMELLTTAAHAFYLVRVLTQNDANGVWHMGSPNPGPALYAYTDGHVYEGAFRTNNRPDLGAAVTDLTQWCLLEVSSITDEWKCFISGTQQGSTQNPNTVSGLGTGEIIVPRLGHNGFQQGKGYFAGLYLFSAKLNSTDRGTLITYINSRFATSFV